MDATSVARELIDFGRCGFGSSHFHILRVRLLEMRKSFVTLDNLLGEPVGLGRLIVG
jgi:hypothetical protein